MPAIGFGTFQLSEDEAEASVYEALKAGFRHIDTAEGFNNETGTGLGIAKFLKEQEGKTTRKNIYVTTKLFPGNPAWGAPEKDYRATLDSIRGQLEKLQLAYVDLYLIQAPFAGLRLEQYKALIEAKRLGLVKRIGVSNYNQKHLQEIINAKLPMPEANQIEFHPLHQHKELTKFMDEKKIAKIGYSSLATLPTWRKSGEGQGGELMEETKVEAQKVQKAIAAKHGVSEARVLLRWGIQRGYAVLARSTKPEHIKENLDVFGFALDVVDVDKLNACNKNQYLAWLQQGFDPIELDNALSRPR